MTDDRGLPCLRPRPIENLFMASPSINKEKEAVVLNSIINVMNRLQKHMDFKVILIDFQLVESNALEMSRLMQI